MALERLCEVISMLDGAFEQEGYVVQQRISVPPCVCVFVSEKSWFVQHTPQAGCAPAQHVKVATGYFAWAKAKMEYLYIMSL